MSTARIESLSELRRRIVEEDDPGDLLIGFLRGIGSRPSFLARGSPTKVPLLDHVVERTCRDVLGRPAAHRLLLRRVEREHLVHGLLFVERRIGAVLFFEDLLTGVLAFAPGVGGDMTVTRFRGIVLDGGPAPRNRISGLV